MGVLESLDSGLTGLVGQWNGYSTGLVTVLVAIVSYQLVTSRDPDVHPMLLARQANAANVRSEGQSAVYRSIAAPHSMPLNPGLNVKDAGASKWSRGRDGDLRDVWRKVVSGGDGGAKGRLLTVLGSENVVDHKLADLTRQINLIGQHITEQGGIRVGVYLPNSIELLVTLFACAFQKNITVVLLPFDVPDDELVSMLRRAAVDTVITATGSFPFDDIVKAYPALRQLIWVVDQGSAHMDWNEVPQGIGSSVSVATWQEIVRDAPEGAGADLPAVDTESTPADIVTFWPTKAGQPEDMIRFTQGNIVAGMAGQIAGLPTKDRLGPNDLVCPADSLTNIHTLIVTLAALYSNASVALNSVAGQTSDLGLATQGVSPTIVIAGPAALLRVHDQAMKKLGSLGAASHYLATSSLTGKGILTTSNSLSGFAAAAKPTIGKDSSKLRLIYTAERVGAATPHLSPKILLDLRALTGSRLMYALSASKVAGAVSQTAFFDYRLKEGKGHFGAPTTSTEIFLKDMGSHVTTDDKVEGEIYVRGPCVADGEAGLGVAGVMLDDNTLAYL